MRLPDDKTKFTNQWKYVEVARYVPELNKVIRHQRYRGKNTPGDPIILEWPQVEDYRHQHHNIGIYTSVWNYNSPDLNRTTRLGPLYFDFDSDDVSRAQAEAIKLVEYLSDYIPEPAIRAYFTGKKGFHIECEPVALGISPTNELPGLYRYIANQLKQQLDFTTLDFAVYDIRRMWRLPNSRHQHSAYYKVELGRLLRGPLDDIYEYAREPHWDEVPEQVFNAKANEWYREWGYKEQEERTLSVEDRIARFSKHGTGVLRKVEGNLEFDPESLLTKCHAINDLWTKAETEHDLSHEERLFLCSILTYTKESQEYLHAILANCDDYDPAKSQSHIDDWIRRREMGIGGRPYSCERANSAGVGCGDCHLEPRERYERVGENWIPTGEMAQPSPIRFGYYRKRKV